MANNASKRVSSKTPKTSEMTSQKESRISQRNGWVNRPVNQDSEIIEKEKEKMMGRKMKTKGMKLVVK